MASNFEGHRCRFNAAESQVVANELLSGLGQVWFGSKFGWLRLRKYVARPLSVRNVGRVGVGWGEGYLSHAGLKPQVCLCAVQACQRGRGPPCWDHRRPVPARRSFSASLPQEKPQIYNLGTDLGPVVQPELW